jgi:hypothetical protein
MLFTRDWVCCEASVAALQLTSTDLRRKAEARIGASRAGVAWQPSEPNIPARRLYYCYWLPSAVPMCGNAGRSTVPTIP